MEYLEIIFGAIGGGTITAAANAFLARRQDARAGFRELSQSLKEEINRLRDEREEKAAYVAVLQKTVAILEAADVQFPFPSWTKSVDGRMLRLNRHYETLFLTPFGKTSRDYIGYLDSNVWPASVAKEYRANDVKAMNSQLGYILTRELIQAGDGTDLGEWYILKYPVLEDGHPVAIKGMAWPPTFDLSGK